MSRHTGWMRQRIDPDTPADRRQTSLARKVLGELMESLARGGLYQGKLRREFDDGTVVIAQFDGTTPIVTVQAPEGTAAPVSVATIDLWIPHGFVFTPGDDSATKGYGLPVVPDAARGSSADPFDAKNVVPGIKKSRWTKNGKCGQVLITRDDTSDYPRTRKRRIPICFDSHEWRTGAYTAPAADKWHAQRPVFNDFTWNAPTAGPRQGLWRDLAAALATPVALPFAGYYDGAQLFADLSATYGTNEAHWPLHYTSPTARANADGVPYSYAEVWSTGAPPIPALQAGLGAVPSGCPLLDVGEQRAFVTATLREPGAWIRAGNQSWIPKDAALPILTWDGYPAQNLPNWLVTGGWVDLAGGDVFPLEGWFYEWRETETRYVFSRNLYSRGRVIGVLPETLIAAAVRTRTETNSAGDPVTIDQLVAVTWQANDQPRNSSTMNYLNTFRVWCVDVPRVSPIALHLETPPVGEYDLTTNPTGWRYAGTFEASDTPLTGFATTAWQMWRFDPTGHSLVAAVGVYPYAADWGPRSGARIALNNVAPAVLGWTRQDDWIPDPEDGYIVAVDFDADGNAVYVWEQIYGNPGVTMPDGTPDSGVYQFVWSRGGDPEVSWWAGIGTVCPDRVVLSARDGAMAFTDHWTDCSGGTDAVLMYRVRLSLAGSRVATDDMVDPFFVRELGYGSTSYLDRFKVSYAATREGDWLIGYDLGVTAGTTQVYATQPICGEAWPAVVNVASSGHLASRWLSSVGDVAAMTKVNSGAMRAFPIGVV